MEWYPLLKHVHMLTAYSTVILFSLRLAMDAFAYQKWRGGWFKRIPHINDSLLLLSAIALLLVTGWRPFEHFWITLKLALVMGYIVTGWFAMRLQMKTKIRLMAALLSYLQIALIFFLATTRPL